MFDITFPLLIAAAALAVAFVWLKFGDKAAAVAGAALALLVTFVLGRRGQRKEIENQVAREELKNEIEKNEAVSRADRAGDAARDTPADQLRDHDPFERR